MNKRLWLGIAAVLLIAVLALVWWPKSVTDHPDIAGEAADEPEWELRFGHNIPVDSALHQAAVRFAEAVARKSDGRVRVRVFPAQQLGNDHQMVELARSGELDIILTPTAKMSVPVPAMQYADLPFYFPTPEDLYAMLDGEPGRMLLDRLRAIDLVGVTFWENGFKHFTGDRPLLEPEDFAGLRIRTMKSRIIMEQFKSFGAIPIPIDFHATRQALADGAVNGQENPLVAIVSMGFHQVQSDLTLSGHGYLGYVFSISARTFERLPQDIREILVTTARELTPWERAETHRREEALLQTIRAAGVRVHTLDADARRRFAARTAHIPARFEAVIGADLLSKTEELLMAKYGSVHGEVPPIVLGLDADLSMDARVSGLAIKRGAMLAIEEINAAGGVADRPLVLLARDHKGMPSRGVSNIEWFAARDDVVAVLAGQHGEVIAAELETVHGAGLPLLLPWSSAAGLVENGYAPNFVFRLSANDRFAGPFLVDHVVKSHRRPAILLENSVWGRGNLRSMSQRLAERGLAFVREEVFNRGERELEPRLDRIADAGADVILMVAKPLEGGLILRSLAQRPSPPPVVSHWGIVGGDCWERNRRALQAVDLSFFQTFTFAANDRPRARALGRRYAERFGASVPERIRAPSGVAQAYDLVHLLARAMDRAGSGDRRAVRDALEQLGPVDGAVKRYAPAFTPARHDALGPEDYHLARFRPDGSTELLQARGNRGDAGRFAVFPRSEGGFRGPLSSGRAAVFSYPFPEKRMNKSRFNRLRANEEG